MKKVIEVIGNIALVITLAGIMYVSFKHDENQRVKYYSGVKK